MHCSAALMCCLPASMISLLSGTPIVPLPLSATWGQPICGLPGALPVDLRLVAGNLTHLDQYIRVVMGLLVDPKAHALTLDPPWRSL